jgi:hypothetical protein
VSGELDGKTRLYYPRCRAYLDVILDGWGEGDDGLGSTDTPMHVEVYPKSAKIHGNSYHQPDSWEMTFDARDCPFDPALIRAATVQIFLYDAGQMEDPEGGTANDNGSASANDNGAATFATPDIVGLFDDDSMDLSNDGRWISVQGQDLTTLFAGKQWPPLPNGRARRIPTGVRLDWFVNDRIREVDPSGKMQVEFEGDLNGSDMPIVGKEQPAGHGRGVPVQQGTTYWDVIYKTVIRCGFVCYVRGWNVVIARPKNLTDYRHADIVKMAWGNNVEHITLQRKLGKQKVPTVIVVAYDENGMRRDPVQWPQTSLTKGKATHLLPKKPATTTHVVEKHTIKGTTAQTHARKHESKRPKATVVKENEEFMIVPIHGTFDPESLLRHAQSLYTLIGRGERRIIVKTHDLTDINGKPLLHLMSGDAVEVHWQDFNEQTMPTMDMEQRADYLTGRGFQPEVAQTLARAYDKLANKLNPPLRLREITKDYDNESGLSIEMELVDFAVVGGIRS